jgi:hypothetical protein
MPMLVEVEWLNDTLLGESEIPSYEVKYLGGWTR